MAFAKKGGGAPKGDTAQKMEGKMKALFGRTPKKSEPDDLPKKIPKMGAAKKQRLSKVRI